MIGLTLDLARCDRRARGTSASQTRNGCVAPLQVLLSQTEPVAGKPAPPVLNECSPLKDGIEDQFALFGMLMRTQATALLSIPGVNP